MASKFQASSNQGCFYSREHVQTLEEFKHELEADCYDLITPKLEFIISMAKDGQPYEYPIKISTMTKSRGGKLLFRDEVPRG